MWVNWESVSEGAKPPHKHIRFSLRNLQFCSYTYQAFFKLLCNIWSKLPSSSEFLSRIVEILVVDIQTFFWTSKNAVKWIQIWSRTILRMWLEIYKFCLMQEISHGKLYFHVAIFIWSNIARIYMKSGWSERSLSVDFELCG